MAVVRQSQAPTAPRLVSSNSGSTKPSVEPTDDAIIDAFERGDPESGALLYGQLARVVDATLFRVLGRYEPERDDLAQMAFEQLVVTLMRGKFARACSLKSWAAAITTKLALNHIRRKTSERKVFDLRLASEELQVQPANGQDPERELKAKDELEHLRGALASISPKLAQAVLMHDGFGYAIAEIATLTSSSVSATQSRLTRGRQALGQALEKQAAGRGK